MKAIARLSCVKTHSMSLLCAVVLPVALPQPATHVRWPHVEQWPTPLASAALVVQAAWASAAHVAKGAAGILQPAPVPHPPAVSAAVRYALLAGCW
jgi:hypothetical protein